MTTKKKNNKVIGDLGERVACKFLLSKGFEILERNFWRKWGEIDIVARKTNVIYFVEVKTVSHETRIDLQKAVSHGTWRPEEQVHQFKIGQIHKALESWIAENEYDGDWQIDVIAVRIVPRETYASVKHIQNIIV